MVAGLGVVLLLYYIHAFVSAAVPHVKLILREPPWRLTSWEAADYFTWAVVSRYKELHSGKLSTTSIVT
jgi:hypothetical protein